MVPDRGSILMLLSNTKSILLADDEEPSRRFLTYYLNNWGYTVTAVGDGLEAAAVLDGRQGPGHRADGLDHARHWKAPSFAAASGTAGTAFHVPDPADRQDQQGRGGRGVWTRARTITSRNPAT